METTPTLFDLLKHILLYVLKNVGSNVQFEDFLDLLEELNDGVTGSQWEPFYNNLEQMKKDARNQTLLKNILEDLYASISDFQESGVQILENSFNTVFRILRQRVPKTGTNDSSAEKKKYYKWSDLIDTKRAQSYILFDSECLLDSIQEGSAVDMSNGGQFLHLTYLLEVFLAKLRQFKINFDIIHFEDRCEAFTTTRKLAMKVILHHAINFLDGTVRVYANWSQDSFKLLVDRLKPSFIVIGENNSLLESYCEEELGLNTVVKVKFSSKTMFGFFKESPSKHLMIQSQDTVVFKSAGLKLKEKKSLEKMEWLGTFVASLKYKEIWEALVYTQFFQDELPLKYRCQTRVVSNVLLSEIVQEFLSRIETNFDMNLPFFCGDLFDGNYFVTICYEYSLHREYFTPSMLDEKWREYLQVGCTLPSWTTDANFIDSFNVKEQTCPVVEKYELLRIDDEIAPLFDPDLQGTSSDRTLAQQTIDDKHWHSDKSVSTVQQNSEITDIHDYFSKFETKKRKKTKTLNVEKSSNEVVQKSSNNYAIFQDFKNKIKQLACQEPITRRIYRNMEQVLLNPMYSQKENNMKDVLAKRMMEYLKAKIHKKSKLLEDMLPQQHAERNKDSEEAIFQYLNLLTLIVDLTVRYEEIAKTLNSNDTDLEEINIMKQQLIHCANKIGCAKVVEPLKPTQTNTPDKYNMIELQLQYDFKFLNAKTRYFTPIVKRGDIELDFLPDTWQTELMDCVDGKKSVVLKAPTSSGKTFIAYYAVEKTLRANDDSIVVFILPNNALCKQVYFDIQHAFVKNYKISGPTMLGIFTRTTRINIDSCQVLVTNPECFKILMLSSKGKKWRENVKFVIFDEIHQINAEGGEVWEHIMALNNAQFIASSASIGAPEKFKDWLVRCKKSVELVETSDRVQSLEYGIYDVKNTQVIDLHPLSTLSSLDLNIQHLNLIPSFSGKNCLEIIAKIKQLKLEHLFEEFYSSYYSKRQLSMTEIIDLKRNLRNTFIELCKNDSTKSDMLRLIKEFDRSADLSKNHFKLGRDDLIDNFGAFILELQRQEMLPCVCFHFDKAGIYRLAKALAIHLCTNDVWLWKDKKASDVLSKQEKVIEDLLEDRADDFEWDDEEEQELLQDLLRFGIGIHHTSLEDSYLSTVEHLFRMNNLPVLIATGTIAFGIHLPCKTVAFIGASDFLYNTVFQQCSGRAGRRGYFPVGKVVTYGIHSVDTKRFLIGDIPFIVGGNGISISFSLQLYYLIKTKRFSVDRIKNVLQSPLYTINQTLSTLNYPSFNEMFMRFSVQFLQENGYINFDETNSTNEFDRTKVVGNVNSISNIISHLHYEEPYNFLLVYFYQQKIFENILLDSSHSWSENLNRFLLVLCYFTAQEPTFGKNRKTLPQLEPVVEQAVFNFSTKYKRSYCNFLVQYGEKYAEDLRDCTLPFSNISFNFEKPDIQVKSRSIETHTLPSTVDDDFDLTMDSIRTPTPTAPVEMTFEIPPKPSTITEQLKSTCYNNIVTSSFSALSGLSDSIVINNEKWNSLDFKHTIFIRDTLISDVATSQNLNAYAYCVYLESLKIGARKVIHTAKDALFMNESALRDKISFFNLHLKVLKFGLAECLSDPNRSVVINALDELISRFSWTLNETPAKKEQIEKNSLVNALNHEIRAAPNIPYLKQLVYFLHPSADIKQEIVDMKEDESNPYLKKLREVKLKIQDEFKITKFDALKVYKYYNFSIIERFKQSLNNSASNYVYLCSLIDYFKRELSKFKFKERRFGNFNMEGEAKNKMMNGEKKTKQEARAHNPNRAEEVLERQNERRRK